MNVKMSEVLNAWPVLLKIGGLSGLPAQVAYRFTKQLRKIAPEINEFQKAQNALVLKHGKEKKDKKGETTYTVPIENREAFDKEMEPLLNKEVEILDAIEWPLTNTALAPNEIAMLDSFITIKEQPDMIQPVRLVRNK
jgi:hypothetical protein